MKTKSSLHFILLIALSLIAPRGTGGAAESGPSDWEKTLKSAEAEGEVTVYVVDYPRLRSTSFTKLFPRSDSIRSTDPAARRFRPALWPNGERENIKRMSM